MNQALGLVETRGLCNAIFVADAMVKTANVQIIELENTRGNGFTTIKIEGDIGAVNAAVNSGIEIAKNDDSLVSFKVIPRPADYTSNVFCK